MAFRLNRADLTLLEERATAMGVRPNLLAHHYVEETLHLKSGAPPDTVVLLLKALREDVAISAEARLSAARQVEKKEAAAWVEKNLRGPC